MQDRVGVSIRACDIEAPHVFRKEDRRRGFLVLANADLQTDAGVLLRRPTPDVQRNAQHWLIYGEADEAWNLTV